MSAQIKLGMVFLEKCPNLTFNVYHGFEGCLLGWDWEQSSLILNTPTKKVPDSFASSMIKKTNVLVHATVHALVIFIEYLNNNNADNNVTKTNTSLVIQLTKPKYLCCGRNSQEDLKAASHDATC